MKTKIFISMMLLTLAGSASAQNNGGNDDFFSRGSKGFGSAREEMYKRYNDFRKQCLKEYSDFVRNAWKDYKADPAVPQPKEPEVVPMIAPGADQQTASWFGGMFKSKDKSKDAKNKTVPKQVKQQTKTSDQLPCKEVIEPAAPIPQPQPISEVKEETYKANQYMTFTVFGTQCKVRNGNNCRFKLKSVSSDAVADAIEGFTETQFDNLLYDCLQERKRHDFSDWAYYQMLRALTKKFYGDTNEAVLAQAFLYSQSGYKMRLAHDGTHLYMLTATHHFIYNKPFFSMGSDWYFMLDGNDTDKLRICEASFPKESSLSLQISAAQVFSENPTVQRTITSRKNPDFTFTITSNKNYIDFYDTYPSSTVNNNFMTRWSMYANTPLEKGIRDQLYPAMKQKLQGMSKTEAVQQLLWWVQGSIDLDGTIQNADCLMYRYDEDVWGVDRAFFGEETLFYPYCDCEDRSILLSHLVRDLVGLDVVLVYYPGHLAMAVDFGGGVPGDFVSLSGRKFVICDPTYIGSSIGETMPSMKGLDTTVILLQKS